MPAPHARCLTKIAALDAKPAANSSFPKTSDYLEIIRELLVPPVAPTLRVYAIERRSLFFPRLISSRPKNSEQLVTHQPAISFSISFQHPFNRAGGRTSNVGQK
jgi:hypothetical protein